MFILSKAIYRVNESPIKITMAFFKEIGQKTMNSQRNLKKKKKIGGSHSLISNDITKQ